MLKIFLLPTLLAVVFLGTSCNPPSDYEVVGGKEIANDGYAIENGKLRMTIESGIGKTSETHLERTFNVAHLLRGDLPFNVYAATLEAKGKKFQGRILSSAFSETSTYPPGVGGTMRIAWDFDEPIETLFDEGFSINFRTNLEGQPEDQSLVFEPKGKK